MRTGKQWGYSQRSLKHYTNTLSIKILNINIVLAIQACTPLVVFVVIYWVIAHLAVGQKQPYTASRIRNFPYLEIDWENENGVTTI
jgi:hypothetical protein